MQISKCELFYPSNLIRGLSSGLHENHLCAVDEKMDTCEGDSGGPLQVKLLHHTRLTPFIVAVTSFGLPCGLSNPGVYTKIAPYHDWIIATMRKSGATIEDDIFNATFCALRFQHFREYVHSSPWSDGYVFEDHGNKNHIYVEGPPLYQVKLMWNLHEGPQHCYGTIIDENTVITVADCVHYQGVPVTSVLHPQGAVNISKINVHPNYNPNFGYNNIAILQLEKLFSFINIRPACINYEDGYVDTVFGVGRKDIYHCEKFPECIDSSLLPLTVYTQPKNESSCRISQEFKPRFPNGITSELICRGMDQFLVSGACDLKIGSSLTNVDREKQQMFVNTLDGGIAFFDYLYPKLNGLVQIGRDCGYGEHLVATRVRSHREWMERVLLRKSTTGDMVQFLDPSRHDGDSCYDEYGLSGRCTSISRCQRKWRKYELTKEASFCSSISVICCPHDEIDQSAWSKKHSFLSRCPSMVNGLQTKKYEAPMVRIFDSSTRYICMGAIISDRTVLTSASCVITKTSLSVQPLENGSAVFQVQAVMKHNSYNSTDYSNDIALLKLTQPLTWSPDLHPACLWTNKTHSPLNVEMLYPFKSNDSKVEFIEVLTMYNSDCQRTHPYQLRDSHICVKYPYRKHTCLPSHSMLRWEGSQGVPYLIGLATDTRECESWYYMTFSRVEAFVDWIADNIDDEEIRRSFRVR